jgi:pyrroline-5-carboxylate reductase
MKTKSLGFIGGGRITKIFLQAFRNKNIGFRNIVVFDTNPEITGKLKELFPQIEVSGVEECAAQDVVFVALHPPVIAETLDRMASRVSDKTIVISLAPKVKIETIIGKLKNASKIVRLIPNATSVINEGYNPVCLSCSISTQEKTEILELLGVLGNTFEVPERKLEAYAIISAMSPTYFWFQWKKLCDIGMEVGLDKDEANQTVYQTMIAALNTMFKSGLKDKEVFDLIPVKPMGENEKEIESIFEQKLKGLYNKLSS